MHVSVKVRLTSGAAPHHGNAPAQLIALLEAHRSAIDVWLRRDAANPHLLLTDPIAAMRKAGVKLAPEVAASLERARGRASAADVLPAGVELRGLTVGMETAREGDRQRGAAAATPAKATMRRKRGNA